MKRIAINGFGRIGRLTFRNLLGMKDVEIVAINDLTDNRTLAHLLRFDSAQGVLDNKVDFDDNSISIDGKKIHAFSIKDPATLPWADLKVDVVLECTGIFTSKEKASAHITAGAKYVIISAPADGTDIQTIVMGVNEDQIDRSNQIFSNASCTTNCLAPLAKVICDNWGFVSGAMVTIHAYTQDQRLQDSPHKDLRRARAAAVNIIPTTTGAAKAAGLVVPGIKDKMSAMSYRVPIITGSIVELSCVTEKPVTKEEVNAIYKEAALGRMKNVFLYSESPLVSSDIVGIKYSSIFDSLLTTASGTNLKVVSWYDNEAGYSARLADLALLL
ncbi:MAG: type I glyceraldehyde-3-phosphate dehydrogenase [Saprospiraceae bacterium]|jgi:glyceraldehyde 3-phosphate dehydrogenase|nr:type I glyceraldehyde-3-phosphate dehydrogenase [Saprospiraceae bacterium]MBL0293109.1 type I glyceraldehyde-3-phosphate dehydrogenase [Saprospiraceae bacterium]